MHRTLWIALGWVSSLVALERWTIDEILKLKQIAEPVISPDGRWVVYALSGMAPAEDRRFSDLYVVASDGRVTRRLTHDDDAEEAPQWTPDSRSVCYLSRQQVWCVAAAGGPPAQLMAHASGVRSFAWSPDGSRVLYAAAEPKSPEQAAHEKEWGVVISPEEQWPTRTSLWMLDAASRRAARLTEASLAPGARSFTWSPDSRSIAYVAAQEAPQPYLNLFPRPVFQGTGQVWLLEVATSRSRLLTPHEYPGLARLYWSRSGAQLAFLAKPPGTQHDRTALDRLHVLSLADGSVKSVAPGFDFYRGGLGLAFSAGDREIWFLNGERMGANVFAVDSATGRVRHVTTGPDTLSGLTFSSDFTTAAIVRENANLKPDLSVARLPRWEERRITDINPEVRRFAHGPGEIIRYPSEGRHLEALLVKPPDFDRSRKYPLLLILHGGPAWNKKNDWRPEWEQHPIQAYAAQGYCLVFPNVRGSADYGPEFRQANYQDLGGGDYRDALAAVDYLIAQGFIDQSRLGVAGWSYGGFLTAAAITKTDRFKAAQLGAGIPSFEAMYSELSTVEWIIHENFGKRPWEDPQTHIRFSPLYSASKVKTPTLIHHGEDDLRCPVAGAVLFYKALKFYGVPAVLEIYPQEGHGIRGPLLRRRCLRRNLEWFNKWLQGDRTTSFEKLFPAP